MEPFCLFTVEFVLKLPNRPIALFPGLPRELPSTIRVGDKIELRRPDGARITTTIAGIEHAKMIKGGSQWPLRLPDTVKSDDVSEGTQVWWISSEKP